MRPDPSLDQTERAHRTAALLLGGLVVLALALRFWRLGEWNLQATEIFTLRDSVTPQFRNPRPLGYLLTYYLVRPFLPLDEFGLRLLPAVFGVLAIPALYFVTRRLVGAQAGLLGALLLAVSPLHISDSQLARYWSLVFLLSSIYPFAIYLGIVQRSRRMLALGIVTAILAALAHPVSVLLFGGLGLFLATRLRRDHLALLWRQKAVRWTAVLFAIFIAAMVVRFIPVLREWIGAHDKNPGSGQFLLRPPVAPGLKQVLYLLAYVESLTVPVALSAGLGIYLLWRGGERSVALLLGSLAIFPMAFLSLISLRTPVSTYYLLPAAPVFFMGAGVFLDRLLEADWKLRPRWLPAAMVVALSLAACAPTLISDYRNGRRYDFRAAASWLDTRLTGEDIVFSDQPMVLAHYLKGADVKKLRPDPAPLNESLGQLDQSGRGGTLWIVAPAPSHALRTNLKQGGLIGWILDNCQLKNIVGRGRVDFRQQYLQVYRCPPMSPRGDHGLVSRS
jgi:Dolichyl-phosphate-mannose-protein mannosyltransferase